VCARTCTSASDCPGVGLVCNKVTSDAGSVLHLCGKPIPQGCTGQCACTCGGSYLTGLIAGACTCNEACQRAGHGSSGTGYCY
jgi:hypothetical protein